MTMAMHFQRSRNPIDAVRPQLIIGHSYHRKLIFQRTCDSLCSFDGWAEGQFAHLFFIEKTCSNWYVWIIVDIQNTNRDGLPPCQNVTIMFDLALLTMITMMPEITISTFWKL